MSFKKNVMMAIGPYLPLIETHLQRSFDLFGKNKLRSSCEYALNNGGKRFRPALVLMISRALNPQAEAFDAAIATEFFHTASLIADDLPCMDDDVMRRERPSLHVAFDEAIALLTSYCLISAGYEKIRLNAARDPHLLFHAMECATRTTGVEGASGGQFLDLYPHERTPDFLFEVIQKKTGALFELSFVFGWIFGGGSLDMIPLVKKSASHFGLAFQIVDDFHDLEKDRLEKREINAPLMLGEKIAREILGREICSFKETLKELKVVSKEINLLVEALQTEASSS